MKVVLDTNVVISGTFFSGPPLEILRACRAGRFQIVMTKEILLEYRQVAGRFLEPDSTDAVNDVLAGLLANALVIDAPALAVPVCRDPLDDKFIACAIAGNADAIVSGDKDLLALVGQIAVSVLTPRQFLSRLSSGIR